MPPHAHDENITDDIYLLRALQRDWIVTEQDRERPTSEALTDSSYENSCFMENEISIEDIHRFLAEQSAAFREEIAFARIPVAVVRASGFAIERRPEEAQGSSNPNAHVVVGPIVPPGRKQYSKIARGIVKDLSITIIRHRILPA